LALKAENERLRAQVAALELARREGKRPSQLA
jgi:hypothetical protein